MIFYENSVVYDFETDDSFPLTAALNDNDIERKWKSISFPDAEKKHFKSIRRYIRFFYASFQLFLHRKQIKNMVCWQQFYGLIFAFYSRLFHSKKTTNLTVLTFIYKERFGWLGKIYFNWMRYIVDSKYIDNLVCFSENECEYNKKLFPNSKHKFRHTKFGVIDDSRGYLVTAKKPDQGGGYLFSVGRSNRDYDFLINALKHHNYNLVIACDSLDPEKGGGVITIRNDITYGAKLYELISKCFCVVIALEDIHISSGQFVFIQAMMFGKPIIVTRTNTLEQYVVDKYNGIIIEKNQVSLVDAIKILIEDDILYRKISENARKKYESQFTIYAMGKEIAELVNYN